MALLNDERDVIIAAATAGGKTEAAFLPLISLVLEQPIEGGFDLVYVGPLRALINDQFERVNDLCVKAQLPVYPWHGDISRGVKARARKDPQGILLITPESLEALFVLRGLEIPTLFRGVRAIIIDELHALLDNERGMHLRSLLTRLELAVNRRIRRVGLSATLGEMALAREYLRPDAPEAVELLESSSDARELMVQIRGYLRQYGRSRDKSELEETSIERAVVRHLFDKLRGSQNLIFAGSRQSVEWYSDALREMSEKERIPVEFFPHHANLSREHRADLESRLKSQKPTTAVCTSTLELGIDIGDIASVAQIGAPFSVASLRQRLGRSGRRPGKPAVLRIYAISTAPGANSHPLDYLNLNLIRSVAMVQLLSEQWCEPPAPESLHLSTLTHQILSVITEHGGIRAKRLYATLCEQGPFRSVDSHLFIRLLRQLGRSDVALIEQAPDGSLLLGSQGERLVEHYNFYSVFQTPEEYRIIAGNRQLGTMPVNTLLALGMTIIFSGQRWCITGIQDEEKVIEVTPDRTGQPPRFGGDGGIVHDKVITQMMELLSGTEIPNFIDSNATRILDSARSAFQRFEFTKRPICKLTERNHLIATWSGTVKTTTLALALQSMGYIAETYDGFLNVSHEECVPPIEASLKEIVRLGPGSMADMLSGKENLMTQKFHAYLCPDLLMEDAASSRVDFASLPRLAQKLLENI